MVNRVLFGSAARSQLEPVGFGTDLNKTIVTCRHIQPPGVWRVRTMPTVGIAAVRRYSTEAPVQWPVVWHGSIRARRVLG